MAEKQLKSIKFPGLDDTYVVVGKVDVDTELSATSENPVQNKVIKRVVDDLTAQIADEYIKKTVSSEDEGKFLRIVNGVATWTSIPNVREGSF